MLECPPRTILVDNMTKLTSIAVVSLLSACKTTRQDASTTLATPVAQSLLVECSFGAACESASLSFAVEDAGSETAKFQETFNTQEKAPFVTTSSCGRELNDTWLHGEVDWEISPNKKRLFFKGGSASAQDIHLSGPSPDNPGQELAAKLEIIDKKGQRHFYALSCKTTLL